GATAVFSVSAVGAGTLHYQWYLNNQPIGTDAPELALPAVQQADDGALVHVVVTDDNGSAASPAAMLTVVPCNMPYADADADGDVDIEDYAILQICYTGTLPPMWADSYCHCFD